MRMRLSLAIRIHAALLQRLLDLLGLLEMLFEGRQELAGKRRHFRSGRG
jgi:hypothetical protein